MTRPVELVAAAFAGAALALLGSRLLGPGPAGVSTSAHPGSARDARSGSQVGGGGEASRSVGSVGSSGSREAIQSLREALEAEAIARETLASDVELMRAVLEQLIPSSTAANAAGEDPDERAGDEARLQHTPDGSFDVLALESVGVASADAADVRERWEETALSRLDVTDRATREGWAFTKKHREEMAALDTGLRSDLGERGYDQMLYATGQPNRIEVKDVLGDSAASVVGIQKGDLVLGYDGVRVFKPPDLRRATTEGRRGEMVTVQVERAGRTITLSLPRGPVGILMAPKRVAPQVD